MGLSKTEVNLKRLLVTAPQQQNQAKLIHYAATLRELLEQLAEERNPDGLPSVHSNNEERSRDTIDPEQSSAAVKLDDAARTHIENHRRLQEDLTDEMVVLARQLKESSLMMNQSIKNTEKILDSTEKAVEHSLGSTGHATSRAMDVYSRSFKTTCFQWLLIFVMTLVFVMVVLLIRVT